MASSHEKPAPPAPPRCGKRLLSHVIDERANKKHARPFVSIPKTANEVDGFRDISYGVFANAINRLATWLLYHMGNPSRDCETIVYVGPSDLRYQITTMAAVKAGYVMFFPSPRNSAEAFASLLNECDAEKLLTTETPPQCVSLIKKPLQQFTIPSLDELLDETPAPVVPLDVTWREYRYRPFLQIHTSGSTGIPKLMTLKHGNFTAVDAFQLLQINELAQRLEHLRAFVGFPLFHMAGILYGLAIPIWVDSTVILPPAKPLNAELVNSVHIRGNAEFTLLAPSLIMDLAKNDEWSQNLTKLKGVTFAGGPLPEGTGSVIASRTNLYAGYGATEWQAVPLLPKPPEDWAYFRFNDKEGGLEFRERDEGLYEMVIVRRKESELAQPVFVTFPQIEEFASKDLFSKHPVKAGLWKYASRLDDILVFSNGEKHNPVSFENQVTTSPDVNGCLVIGQGRFQALLLVELKNPEDSQSLEKIWPYIKRANEATVKHGRIARDHVIFTSPNKPFPRAGKGTIQRASANKLYEKEIDEFYSGSAHEDGPLLDLSTVHSTKLALHKFIREDVGIDEISEHDDFFAFGMDSLQLINIVRAINNSRSGDPIEAKQVYDNSTVDKLAQFLHAGVPISNNDYDSDDEEQHETWLAMDDMFKKLTANEKPVKRSRPKDWLVSTDEGPVIQPDGGTVAWLQVLSCFLVNINNWGLVNTFGVFQAYYETTLLSNYQPSSISWIGTLQGALLLIVGVVSGPLFDQGYFKAILVASSIGLVISLFTLSVSTEFYQIFLSQGILMGICSGFLYVPSVALIPTYFKHRRGLAIGLATCGGSIGGILYPVIFSRLLSSIGFGWAVRTIAFIALLTLGVAAVIARPLGPRMRRQLLDSTALYEVSYVSFTFAAFLLFAAILVPFFLGASFSTQSLGSSESLGFYTLALLNTGQFFGRVLPAAWSDLHHRFLGAEVLLAGSEILCGILGFAWIGVRSYGGFVPWLLIYGFASGMCTTLPAVVLPHISPSLAIYGTRLGMLYACAGIGFLISSPIASALNSSHGGFMAGQIWTGACCLAASVFASVVAVEARKRRMAYESGKRKRGTKRGIVTTINEKASKV